VLLSAQRERLETALPEGETSPDDTVVARLYVVDLGRAAWFIRMGRAGLDLLASFLFAPIGLFAVFLGLFTIVFAAERAIGFVFRLVGWSAGMDFVAATAGDIPVAEFAAAVGLLLAAVAAIAASVAAARAPRLWGIVATLLFACAIAFFFHVVAASQETIITWTGTILLALLTYGVLIVASAAALLLVSGLVLRRGTVEGRTMQRWPRFSIPIYVARYGIGRRVFWRRFFPIAVRLVLLTALLALLFVGAIFVLMALAAWSLPSFGIRSRDWHAIFFAADIVLWALVFMVSIGAAIRTPATRAINLAVGALALFATGELVIDLRLAEQMTGPLVAMNVFISPVSESELQFLNLVPIIWLFRSLVSRAWTAAYGDLKRSSARTARELADRRPERPILFLRSFMDDEQLVPSSDTLLGYAFGAQRDRLRLEEIVAEIMFARGPLVALANPFVRSAPLGAARDVSSDEDWQNKVLTYLAASQIVVCFLGKTRSFLWEIDRIVAEGKLDETLIVLPPSYPHDRRLFHDAPNLAGLIGLRDEADEQTRLDGARVLVHDAASGRFCAVRSRRADSSSYREAILIGAAMILQNGKRKADYAAIV
jgi:hypothetical protein